MYSTGCWNYRLSQYRRYNKEREKIEKMTKWYILKRTLLYMYSFFWFFFEKRKYRSSDSLIKEKRWNDSFIQWISNNFFFYQILLLFPRTRVHLPSGMPDYSHIYCNYILLCTLVTDKLDFKQASSIKALSPPSTFSRMQFFS